MPTAASHLYEEPQKGVIQYNGAPKPPRRSGTIRESTQQHRYVRSDSVCTLLQERSLKTLCGLLFYSHRSIVQACWWMCQHPKAHFTSAHFAILSYVVCKSVDLVDSSKMPRDKVFFLLHEFCWERDDYGGDRTQKQHHTSRRAALGFYKQLQLKRKVEKNPSPKPGISKLTGQ